jgi:hypothetical protein
MEQSFAYEIPETEDGDQEEFPTASSMVELEKIYEQKHENFQRDRNMLNHHNRFSFEDDIVD